MNSQNLTPEPEWPLNIAENNAASSVDDFIRELEAKEKDLHITSDMTIEIEESDSDEVGMDMLADEKLASVAGNVPAKISTGAQTVGAKTRIYELEQEIEKLKERVAGLRSERNEIQEKSDQRLKDFQNYKYRMDRERRGSFIDQISNLATQMLPVLDNLDRALESVSKLENQRSGDFQEFFNGIVLVNHQVREIFSEMGVEPVRSVGEIFDPNFHEAVSIEDNDDLPPNTITEEMLCGYRIGNRVIRHSMVKVTASAPTAKSNGAENVAMDEMSESDLTDDFPQPGKSSDKDV